MNFKFWLQPIILRLLLLFLVLGLAGASALPVLSTHLATNLNIQPLLIGIFFGTNTLAGIGVSQWLAKRSDAGLSRLKILYLSNGLSAIGSMLFGHLQWFPAIMVTGMVWFGFSSTAAPQLFALAREQIDDDQAALVQSVLRAAVSISWIIGPPLAYLVFEEIGFRNLMIFTAVLYGLALLLLPGLKDARLAVQAPSFSTVDFRITGLILVLSAIFAANTMYLVYMPLYVRNTLGLISITPGILMGVAAGLEIPIMIGSGAHAHHWPLFAPLKVASFCGVIFYSGILWFENFTILLVLQIFNAALIGLAAGLGISIFQSLMKERLGMASTLYTNAIRIGSLAGSALGGVIAQWGGFDLVFLTCALLAAVALGSVYYIAVMEKKHMPNPQIKFRPSKR
ncbi:MAG: sugar efflux transporter [Desulfobacteraceae bacterium]|jgi:SET family sugar efflux transporter-like MFS transporter